SFSSYSSAQSKKARLLVAVRVRVDGAFDALALGIRPMTPVHVEAVRAAIKLDPGTRFRTGVNESRNIDFVGLAFQQQSARRVGDNMNEAILGGGNETLGILGFGLTESLVETGDHNI